MRSDVAKGIRQGFYLWWVFSKYWPAKKEEKIRKKSIFGPISNGTLQRRPPENFWPFFARIKKSKRRCLQNITQSENHQYRWLNGQEKVRKKKADVHLPDLQKNWGLVFSFRDKKKILENCKILLLHVPKILLAPFSQDFQQNRQFWPKVMVVALFPRKLCTIGKEEKSSPPSQKFRAKGIDILLT